MKLLLLLTTSFPYDSGEEFLLNEVRYISGYDRVLICPCNLKKDSVVTKPVPEKISVIPLRKKDFGKSAYLKLLARPYVVGELFRLISDGGVAKNKAHEMLYFMKNAVALYDELIKIPDLQSADEVTIYSYWFYDAAAAGALLAGQLKKQGKKVKQVSRAHGFDVYEERTPYLYLPMRPFLLERVDALFPCSQNGADTIAKQYPRFAGKIRPAFLGTTDYGAVYGSRKPVFHVVTCSSMSPVKRLHLLIEALALVKIPVRWTHIGSGPLAQELRAKAAQLPENVQVEFTGQMDNASLMSYYRSTPVSVLVNVSSHEGIPVSIMEACSFGLPIIATDVGGTGEAVRDGETGFLLPREFKPAVLAEKLTLLSGMENEKYTELCQNARKLWLNKFDAPKNYSVFYEEISKWN